MDSYEAYLLRTNYEIVSIRLLNGKIPKDTIRKMESILEHMNFKEDFMENYCAFSRDHKCILWLDYEITRQELEECHTLCHGNWIEIEHKYKYIQELRHLLDEHGIPYPEEYEIDYGPMSRFSTS